MKRLEQSIVQWLKRKVKAAKAQGIVFGLSGGIDSAVVAGLVKKAVGDNHQALLLPCHSSAHAHDDAQVVVKAFGLTSRVIDLTKVNDLFLQLLPEGTPLAMANVKPRLRMLTLYYVANAMNYLVAGTGNKSELGVGYFTKYGDGGVDILPIGDLYKKDVRRLAHHLGVPKLIIDKPPTADLWPGQTDEGEMQLRYEELDEILGCLASGRRSACSRDKVARVKKLMKASEHKRKMPETPQVAAKLTS